MTVKIWGFNKNKNEQIFCGIYDISGNLILDVSQEANLNKNETTTEFEVNTSGFPSGIYFIQMESGRDVTTKKFMVIE